VTEVVFALGQNQRRKGVTQYELIILSGAINLTQVLNYKTLEQAYGCPLLVDQRIFLIFN
jgi:hypothetical protein